MRFSGTLKAVNAGTRFTATQAQPAEVTIWTSGGHNGWTATGTNSVSGSRAMPPATTAAPAIIMGRAPKRPPRMPPSKLDSAKLSEPTAMIVPTKAAS